MNYNQAASTRKFSTNKDPNATVDHKTIGIKLTNSHNDSYVPFEHPKQHLASKKHIVLDYFDKTIPILKEYNCVQKELNVKVFVGIIMFVTMSFWGTWITIRQDGVEWVSVMLFAGAICGLVLIFNNRQQDEFKDEFESLSTNVVEKYLYAYYCYDISDQYIKLITIKKCTYTQTDSNDSENSRSFSSSVKYKRTIKNICNIDYFVSFARETESPMDSDSVLRDDLINVNLQINGKQHSRPLQIVCITRNRQTRAKKSVVLDFVVKMNHRINIINQIGIENLCQKEDELEYSITMPEKAQADLEQPVPNSKS